MTEATMILDAFRERLIYLAMSAFVAWHTLAIVVAPASQDSVISQGMRAVLQPYLTLFRLDNTWDFFAPNVDSLSTSRQFLYVIEDSAQKKHFYMPEADFSGLEPRYFWFRAWHFAVIDNADEFGDVAAAFYCRKHVRLQPVAIILLASYEKPFTRTDFLSGKKRWDPEFVAVKTIKRVKCQAE
jgi:hypothetical protein